ncbi:MAG TPA: acyltransferase, partial [Bryobacteraceae bacterium]|nr:acyltransferase [Bryobacteraceae bacterium]
MKRLLRWLSGFALGQALIGGYRYYTYSEERRLPAQRFGHLGSNTRIGENAHIVAPERCHVGSNCAIGGDSIINAVGGFHLGDYSVMAGECMVFTTEHRFVGAGKLPFDDVRQVKPVYIGDYVWIGARVMIHAGIRIGDGAIVGMGSVVNRDVPPLTIVAGNPAIAIGKRPQQAFEELRAEGRGRNPREQCAILWVPPFTRSKFNDVLGRLGFEVADGEEYFL